MAKEQTEKHERPPAEDGRRDEVDASKGIFPFGTKHPAGAELKQAGALGGASYAESGRSGLDALGSMLVDAEGLPPEELDRIAELAARTDERKSTPSVEPKGVLPAHRESRA